MPSPTINSKMAQAQVLALFNQTMKFGASEPSIGSADPSTLEMEDAVPVQPNVKATAAPVFQIFQDGNDDEDKENAGRAPSSAPALAPPPSMAPFAIFKDPTEKLNVPTKSVGGAAKLSGILKSTVPTPTTVLSENNDENVFTDHRGVVGQYGENENGGKKQTALRQQSVWKFVKAFHVTFSQRQCRCLYGYALFVPVSSK